MKRRSLLKSIGALGMMPLMPSLPASAIAGTASSTVSAGVSGHTYKWAEMIVRAHNKCSPGMLERLLKVDTATASALKSQLMEKGVISAQANSFGIHKAVKPLYEGAFMKPSSQLKTGLEKANEMLDDMIEEDDPDSTREELAFEEPSSEIDSENKDLAQDPESIQEDETELEYSTSA
jgi:hypothetical protein